MQFLVENNLRNSSAVAQVDENQLAEIAPAMDPAHEHDVFIGVGGAEGATIICAFQISESFEQFCRPFFGLSAIAAAAIYSRLEPTAILCFQQLTVLSNRGTVD